MGSLSWTFLNRSEGCAGYPTRDDRHSALLRELQRALPPEELGTDRLFGIARPLERLRATCSVFGQSLFGKLGQRILRIRERFGPAPLGSKLLEPDSRNRV